MSFQNLQQLLCVNIPNIDSLIRRSRYDTLARSERKRRKNTIVVETVPYVLSLDFAGFHICQLPSPVKRSDKDEFRVRRPVGEASEEGQV